MHIYIYIYIYRTTLSLLGVDFQNFNEDLIDIIFQIFLNGFYVSFLRKFFLVHYIKNIFSSLKLVVQQG